MMRLPFQRPRPPLLEGAKVELRPPLPGDFAEWAAVRSRSREFLTPWEPRWTSDELERPAWNQRLRRYRDEQAQGTGVPFLIFAKADGRLAGGITVGNIRRGVAQTGQIGYWMSVDHAGRGLMLEAVRLVLDFSFDTLKLHRMEAACIPSNGRSVRVLEKAGFRREGLLRSYLRINGAWQDHYLYALVSDDPGAAQERG